MNAEPLHAKGSSKIHTITLGFHTELEAGLQGGSGKSNRVLVNVGRPILTVLGWGLGL